MFRQGDVLFVKASRGIPEDAKSVLPQGKRFVLAEGEATGHAHAVEVQEGLEVKSLAEQLFMVVDVPVKVVHEEHDTITIPPGEWRVVRQVEYEPGALRRVLD